MKESEGLGSALQGLRQLGLIPACGQRFKTDTSDALSDLVTTLLADVPEYSQSRNPDVVPQLQAHCADHLEYVAHALSGTNIDPQFIVEHARRLAEQHFPLDASLRAYQSLSRWLADHVRDAAIAVADSDQELRRVVATTASFALEYTSFIAGLVTREYVAATRMLAEAAGDRKTELINLLLNGFDESDRRAAALLRSSGYLEQRQTYAVIAVRAVKASEMDDAQRVERIQDSVKDVLHDTRVRLLLGQRNDLVVAVVSATHRLSGWTRPHTLTSDLVVAPLRLMGNAVLIGISSDVPSTAHIPRALREAEQALRYARRNRRVLQFSKIGLVDLIMERANHDRGQLEPAWLKVFHAKDRHGKLALTLHAYAENDMNVIRTAKHLGMHPNSMYARFAKIEALTGLAPQRFHALMELLLGLRLQAI